MTDAELGKLQPHSAGVKTKPLKVAFLSIVPSPYQRDLFAALSEQPEVELSVFYCEAGSPDSPWAKQAHRDFETVLPGFYCSWGGSRFLVNHKVPDLNGYDLLVLNGYMMLAAQRLLRRWLGKLPILFWGERMVGASAGLKGVIQRRLAAPLERIAGIVAIGERAVADYKRRYPQHKVYNLPYYCDLTEFEELRPEARPRNPITLFFCGQMIARKGVDVLFDAFAQLIDSGMEARLLLVGREAEIHEMLAGYSEQVRAAIEYAGFKQPAELPQYFAEADVFILPSRYDGWGVVVNQALGAGLPIICSDEVGAGYDLVDEGKNGFVFEANNAGDLHRCLRELIEDKALLAQAAQLSAEKAGEWVPEVGARRWVSIVEEVCRKN